jgi:hypothetical protein
MAVGEGDLNLNRQSGLFEPIGLKVCVVKCGDCFSGASSVPKTLREDERILNLFARATK